MVAMPERCWTVFKALRSAVSRARALPETRISAVPGATRSPSVASISISHPGVEVAEEGGGQRQAGDGDRLAAVHHPGEARLGRDDALGGDVAPAAGQALAQVLGQRGDDEGRRSKPASSKSGRGKGVVMASEFRVRDSRMAEALFAMRIPRPLPTKTDAQLRRLRPLS